MGAIKTKILDLLIAMLISIDTALGNSINFLNFDFINVRGSGLQAAFYDAYRTVYGNIRPALIPIATTIIATCYMIELGKDAVKLDAVRFETGIKLVIKFTVANAALNISSDLLIAIYGRLTGVMNTMVTSVGSAGSIRTAVETPLRNLINGMGTWDTIGFAITMIVVFLVIWVVVLLVYVMAISRATEIILYIAIAPLPAAFIPLEHSRIPIRFATSFVGVVLQGLVIFVSIFIYNKIISTAITATGDIVELAAQMLVCTFVMAFMVFKSGSFAKSILGG